MQPALENTQEADSDESAIGQASAAQSGDAKGERCQHQKLSHDRPLQSIRFL
jgi:hypothetical protein